MTLFACCLAGTALCYYFGLKSPGRGNGTTKGWVASLIVGVLLGALYYAFSAYGLLFSLDSLLGDF